MKVQGANRIYKQMSPFLLICKFLGLAPYTVVTDSLTGIVQFDTSVRKNFGGLLCTMIISTTMVLGISDMIAHYKVRGYTTATDTLRKTFCYPMFFILPLVAIILNTTLNKNRFTKLLKLFSSIDTELETLKRSPDMKENKMRRLLSHFDIFLLVIILMGYMIYDAVIFGMRFFLMKSYALRISELVNLALIMQCCKFVKLVWQRLSEFSDVISQFIGTGNSDTGKKDDSIFQISKIRPESMKETPQDVTKVLISLRRMYRQVCDAVNLLNIIFGFIILLEIATNFAVIITNVSTLVKYAKEKSNKNKFLPNFYRHFQRSPAHKPFLANCAWLVMSTALLTTMIVLCEITTWKSKKLGAAVFKMSFNHALNADASQQVELFLNQIYNNPFEFTAFWLFSLNSNLLCTIFASAVTFAIILSQLN